MRQQLLITLEEDGRIQVQGPIQNKLLCYGLLGVAHDVIEAYKGGPALVVPEVRLGHPADNGQPI